MSAIASGGKELGGLFGIRVCLLLVFVFFCAIDRSSTIDATTRHTTDALSFRHPGSLTNEQRSSAVTIEFDFKHIDKKNRTVVEVAYREVRRTFLEYLNRKKSTTASPTYSTTAASNTTAAVTTAITLTTISTTLTIGTVGPWKKRKRRTSGGNNDTFTEDDLLFVENDPEIDENGNLRISIFIYREGFDDLELYEVAKALNESGKLEAAVNAPVSKIYRGLPQWLSSSVGMPQLGFKLWLPILLTTSLHLHRHLLSLLED